jgi:hypothetical protein
MPDFYVDDLVIEPYEFVRECSKSEIKELIIELVEEEHLPKSVLSQMKTDKNGKSRTSILEDDFLEKMDKLSQKFHTITKEDEEILETIFKKYN